MASISEWHYTSFANYYWEKLDKMYGASLAILAYNFMCMYSYSTQIYIKYHFNLETLWRSRIQSFIFPKKRGREWKWTQEKQHSIGIFIEERIQKDKNKQTSPPNITQAGEIGQRAKSLAIKTDSYNPWTHKLQGEPILASCCLIDTVK